MNQLYLNANIITCNPDQPSATALVTNEHGKIVFVGDRAEALKCFGDHSEVHDCQQATLLPGLFESHGHFMGTGMENLILNLRGSASFEEVIERTVAYEEAHPELEWIVGRGWDHNLWQPANYPDHRRLSQAIAHRPVFLTRVDGHSALVNQCALQHAQINSNTADPTGGTIGRFATTGEASGILIDNAIDLVRRKIPDQSERLLPQALRVAEKICLQNGITSFVDAGSSRRHFECWQQADQERPLHLTIFAYWDYLDLALRQRLLETREPLRLPPQVEVVGVKFLLDGALGSHGAWLSAPYQDRPQEQGLQLMSGEEYTAAIQKCAEQNYQIATHAIGDAAVALAVRAYAQLAHPQLRPRIEHCELIQHSDLLQLSRHQIIASVQSIHWQSDRTFLEQRLGATRLQTLLFNLKSAEAAKVHVCNGSDTPIESINPFVGMASALASTPQTRQQILNAYTCDAAYATFSEQRKGALKVGFDADFILIDRPLMSCPAEEIALIRVLATIQNGQRVY